MDCDLEGKEKVFMIHKDKDDFEALVQHLGYLVQNRIEMIGFNNLNFDSQVIQYIMDNTRYMRKMTSEEKIKYIYDYSQDIIDRRNRNEWLDYKEKDLTIKQIDLFKIHHLDNKAKTARLKDIQVAMNWHNVQDMPVEHDVEKLSLKEVNDVIGYCGNDIFSTLAFYKVTIPKIELRETIKRKYGIDCINYSNTKIGSELLLRLYCDRTGKDYWTVKNLRTPREHINFNDIIFPYIKFETKEFKNLLDKLKQTVVNGTKGTFRRQVTYKGFTYEIAQGGIHGCIKPGVYKSNSEYIIMDADVASLYPSIAIVNNLYPKHLGKEFCKVYKEDLIDVRLREKAKGKDGDPAIVDGFKEAANASYGNSNSEYSWLYDPQYTMQTTINGQLMLCMLSEMLCERISDITVLQINTDGITVRIKRSDIENYKNICKEWERKTNLMLEFAEYDMMAIRDVNNYIAKSTKGKIKLKGAYETEKLIGSDIAYYKDNSFRIISEAALEYFDKGISAEDYIRSCTDIFKFTGRAKFKSDSYGETRAIIKGEKIVNKQQKTTRYYISRNGRSFVKVYLTRKDENGNRHPYKEEIINVGYRVTIYNKHLPLTIRSYDIDYDFYIEEANKLIDAIEGVKMNKAQLSLF